MTGHEVSPDLDLLVVGAGPVGLMSAYLAKLCGLSAVVVDPTDGPLQVGRADALNARTLQLLELAGLFNELYPLGKPCNTSSIWKDGAFVSRRSDWWESLTGCFHKHFLMIGQSHLEKLLDEKLKDFDTPPLRRTRVEAIELCPESRGCLSRLSNGETLRSKFVIGADGSRSFARETFQIPFVIERPQIVWAVIDAVIESDFPKVPEIIVFQSETSDVAWIPREDNLDRFYVRMDTKDFTLEEATAKVNRAMSPHSIKIKDLVWFSRFSVKESVAERFSVDDRIFLAGDSCHIHSVNGGQGLNTGLADAFNLIWKLKMVLRGQAPAALLQSYERERKPVAVSVIESSGELVRATKFSETHTHAEDYLKIVEKRAGNITGMGIRYEGEGLRGQRLQDFEVLGPEGITRLYSLLDYAKWTLVIFSNPDERGDERADERVKLPTELPNFIQIIRVSRSEALPYNCEALLIRPDAYIQAHGTLREMVEYVA